MHHENGVLVPCTREVLDGGRVRCCPLLYLRLRLVPRHTARQRLLLRRRLPRHRPPQPRLQPRSPLAGLGRCTVQRRDRDGG